MKVVSGLRSAFQPKVYVELWRLREGILLAFD